MVFLLKVSIVLFIFLAFYKLILERESFFTVNRYYLMCCLLLAFLLPFITLPKLVNNQGVVTDFLEETSFRDREHPIYETKEAETEILPPIKGDAAAQSSIVTDTASETTGLVFWVFLLYSFGIIILSARFLFQVAGIVRTVRWAEDLVKDTNCTIVNVKDDYGPRSFFNYIFLNPEKYNPETYEQILEHEKIHVKKWHSLDLLISEIAIIILWFNPFIWMFRKVVEKNIEYQTDALMLDSRVVEPKKYQMNLLKIGVARKPLTIVSNYNQSLIKKRIIKMNTRKSNWHSYWKYAFIAPTIFITLLMLNPPFALTAQEKDNTTPANESGLFNIDLGSDNDRAPLLQAAWTGDFEGVKKLVEEGADVNFLQRGEGTALVLAIRQEEFKIARFLLEKGADPNLGTNDDGHPLMIAAGKGNIELVRLLVNRGANVNTKFPGDGSALIQASASGNMAMIKALVDLKADINMEVEGDGNPLLHAARRGYFEIVEYLVGLGADVNREVPGDETPLIQASVQGHLDIVTFLVENGADVNKVCSERLLNGKTRVRTALIMAEQNGHDHVTRYLKLKGARN